MESKNITEAIDRLAEKAGSLSPEESKNATEAIDRFREALSLNALGLDTTLKKEGLAADAKAVGDKLFSTAGGNIDDTNIDDILSTGIYNRFIDASKILGVNSAGASYGLLIVSSPSTTTIRIGQYMWIPHTGTLASRYKTNNTWSSWKMIQLNDIV